MGKKTLAVASVCLGLFLMLPAVAEDASSPESEDGRYTFSKVPDGFVRLDTKSGEVSLCSRRAVGWACQAVPEDRAVLEGEIARLRSENARLKKDILTRGLPLPAGTMPEPPAAGAEGGSHWGSNSDLDRVMAFVNRVWHRLVEVIAHGPGRTLDRS